MKAKISHINIIMSKNKNLIKMKAPNSIVSNND
jgi:hypothetical protein